MCVCVCVSSLPPIGASACSRTSLTNLPLLCARVCVCVCVCVCVGRHGGVGPATGRIPAAQDLGGLLGGRCACVCVCACMCVQANDEGPMAPLRYIQPELRGVKLHLDARTSTRTQGLTRACVRAFLRACSSAVSEALKHIGRPVLCPQVDSNVFTSLTPSTATHPTFPCSHLHAVLPVKLRSHIVSKQTHATSCPQVDSTGSVFTSLTPCATTHPTLLFHAHISTLSSL